MKNVTSIIIIIFTLIIQSCDKKEVYPGETQEGLNTFGVKIDGVNWMPKHELNLVTPLKPLSGIYNTKTIHY